MRSSYSRRPRSHPRPLPSGGQFVGTFAGIGYSIALSLLAVGGYLVARQFEDPIEGQSVMLLLAALLIATSCTLLFYLLHPSSRTRSFTDYLATSDPEPQAWIVVRLDSGRRMEGLPGELLHGRYVDRTRVLIQR